MDATAVTLNETITHLTDYDGHWTGEAFQTHHTYGVQIHRTRSDAEHWNEQQRAVRPAGYMSCPRNCGVDVRAHHSSDLVNGGCDTGPMSKDAMIEWLTARGVGGPHAPSGTMTIEEALLDFYGKSEEEMERHHEEMHGSTA